MISFFVLMFLSFVALEKQEYARRENAFLIGIGHNIERMLVAELNYAKYQIKYIKNQIVPINGDVTKVNSILQNLIVDKEIGDAISWNRISWIDKNDNLRVNSIDGILPHGTKSSNLDYVALAKQNLEKFVIDHKIFGFTSKAMVVPLAMAINDNNGDYLGTIVIGLDVKTIMKKISREIGCNGVEFAVLNGDGNLLMRSKNMTIESLKLILGKQQEQNNTKLINLNKNWLSAYDVAYVHQIPRYPIKIIMHYNPEFSLFRRLLPNDLGGDIYIYVLLIIFCFIVMAMLYLHRMVIKPISHLSTIAHMISRGKTVSFPVFNGIEMQNLMGALIRLQNSFQQEIILRKELSQEKKSARQIADSKNEMTEAICHDLKNHIFAVGGLLEVLRSDFTVQQNVSAEYFKFLNLLGMQIARLQEFVDDLMANKSGFHQYISIEAIRDLQVFELITEAVQIFSPQASRDKIKIEFVRADYLPLVLCNPKHLRQIIANLLSNAIKYSNENSLIRIVTKEDLLNNELIISFIDNGIGITQEDIVLLLKGSGVKISKNGLKKKVASQGLGIRNVKRLLELNGGRLEIESRKNHGSTFSVHLQISKKTVKNPDSNSLELLDKIINIDDNLVNLITTQKKLEKYLSGIKCDVATNSADGLNMIEQNADKYRIALIDIDMPDVTGYDLVLAIRSKNRHLPIVAYSSRNYDEVKHYLHPAMINDYISKENSNDVFFSKIENWLRIANNQDSLFLDNAIARKNIKSIMAGKRIIVIDDQMTNLLIVKKQLENVGTIVEIAQNIRYFWQNYSGSQFVFDVIISDIELSDGSGVEIIKRLRLNKDSVVAIALTGNSNAKEIMHLLKIGFDDYFVKGSSNSLLPAIITHNLLLKLGTKNLTSK